MLTLREFALIYAAAAWGSTFFLLKAVLPEVHPLTLTAYRFLLATLLMAGWLLRQKKAFFKDWEKGWALGWRVWLCYVPQAIGLQFTTATNSGFITGFYIAFVPLVTFFSKGKRRPTRVEGAAIVMSLVGLWVLTNGIQHLNRGDVITLLTAFAYALWLVTSDRYAKEGVDAYRITFQQLLCVTVMTLVVGGFVHAPLAAPSLRAWAIIGFLAIVCTVSTHLVQIWGQRTIAPTKVALILSLEPVFAATFAWTWGGESFAWRQAWGGGLILLAMVMPDLLRARNMRTLSAAS